ncbi:MAG: hypothetical protein JXA92_10035 [candidate division Zixibacteria bacterium]|nr:hypothetical protein [candidate division Zixibacteria bacterium]
MLRTVITFSLIFLSGSLYAQSGKDLSVYLSTGSAVSFGTLSERAPYGFQGMAGLGLKPSPRTSPELEVVSGFCYSYFPAREDDYGDIIFILAGLDFRLHLQSPGANGFYVTVGGGYAYTRIEEHAYQTYLGAAVRSERLIPEITEHNTYFSPGLGYEFGRSQGLRFFIEGRFLLVFGTHIKNNTIMPLNVGIKF